MTYAVEFDPAVVAHLKALSQPDRVMVMAAIRAQLTAGPITATRNRKPMRANPLASWELRVRTLRVYFDVADEPAPMITIRAVGVKIRNVVRIGNREITL